MATEAVTTDSQDTEYPRYVAGPFLSADDADNAELQRRSFNHDFPNGYFVTVNSRDLGLTLLDAPNIFHVVALRKKTTLRGVHRAVLELCRQPTYELHRDAVSITDAIGKQDAIGISDPIGCNEPF